MLAPIRVEHNLGWTRGGAEDKLLAKPSGPILNTQIAEPADK
jgi:hypothetical protein